MKRVIVAGALLASLALARNADAQAPLPLALQLGAGVEVPVGEFSDVAGTGYGFSVGTGFQVVPNVAVYGGYTWIRFDSELAAFDHLTDSGFSAGLSVVFPQLGPSAMPWIGGGLVLHRLNVSGAAQQPGWGDPGFGLGGGVLIPITANLRFSPSLGYVHYNSDFPARDGLTVSYLSVGLGINVTP